MNCCDDYGKCKGGHGCPVGDHVDTGRAPRMLVEAFGPGSDMEPLDMDPEADWPEIGDRLVTWACFGVILLLVVLGMAGQL